MNASTAKSSSLSALDALTGGAFSAATSSERATLIRAWLERGPSAEQMHDVFRELSGRDKGAAKFVRERLDEIRRERAQEGLGVEWAQRARDLLAQPRMNLADGMAWQRDAAKAGAPLGREPLATLKQQLADRVRGIDDLQRRVQIQREAAVLLAQRIETLSTKPWIEADSQFDSLGRDWADWSDQAGKLGEDPHWPSIDPRHPPLLDASRGQLATVWQAFADAVQQGRAAALDAQAPLPAVPAWGDDIRRAREATLPPAAPRRSEAPAVDPAVRGQAQAAVAAALSTLEGELAQGHGKASVGAANALRQALKEHGRWIDDATDRQAQAALASASELGAWHRWRADQLRMDLVRRAEALAAMAKETVEPAAAQPARARVETTAEPPVAPADVGPGADPAHDAAVDSAFKGVVAEAVDAESVADDTAAEPSTEAASTEPAGTEPAGTEPAGAEPAAEVAGVSDAADRQTSPAAGPGVGTPAPAERGSRAGTPAGGPMGGRKMQEALRQLREQWKQADQGGVPNHGLWRRFDEACNRAHEVVEAWLKKLKAAEARHRAERQALIDELNHWAQERQAAALAQRDFKGLQRDLSRFAERWRAAGHLSDKAFAEMQAKWKTAFDAAGAPLKAEQRASIERREALVAEAAAVGAEPQLRIDAVRALQQRWQSEAQSVPLDRKLEQKLWDRFRKPIDDAFARKTQAREQAMAALGERDRAVISASKALAAANASGDAQQIRAAMDALQRALHEAQSTDAAAAPPRAPVAAGPLPDAATSEANSEANSPNAGAESSIDAPHNVAKPTPNKVVAVRGDDRPGAARGLPGGDRSGERHERGDRGRPGPGPSRRDGPPGAGRGRFGDRSEAPPRAGGFRPGGRPGFDAPRGPRLGDEAFRAQRDAMDHAQQALRRLAAQAHGEAVMGIVGAWERRDAAALPPARELGAGFKPAVHQTWSKVLAAPAGPAGDAVATALLRLEMAADVPTPAAHLDARRALQLQLLTRRNDPAPAQTWVEDVARVLAGAHDADAGRRLVPVLKALLRR